jgi:signal transduction histidine kinase
LLDLSRLEAGSVRLVREPVEPALVLAGLADELQPELAARGIEVAIDCEPGLAVDADPLRLHQALGNLFSNAIKFSEHGGKISVNTSRAGDLVVIDLMDRGVGIPANELERVVERFYRASTATGSEGTGLGLAIAKEIVERHGGTMSLTSHLGEGTIATIKLPSSEAVTARRRPPRALAP